MYRIRKAGGAAPCQEVRADVDRSGKSAEAFQGPRFEPLPDALDRDERAAEIWPLDGRPLRQGDREPIVAGVQAARAGIEGQGADDEHRVAGSGAAASAAYHA